jgi:lipid-A-disaccharide synthase
LAAKQGIPVTYFISPQVWAWGRWRLKYIRRFVEHMLVFFAFEEAFYRQAGIRATWIGHPLIEQAQPTLSAPAARQQAELNPWRMTVGLLPGSRAQEIRRHLPLLLETAQRINQAMPGVQFLLPKAPGVPIQTLLPSAEAAPVDLTITEGNIQNALQLMDAAVVCSGTATLDVALAGVPMVVIYRTNWPTYWMAQAVLNVKHIALANIVAGAHLVPERIQTQATPRAIAEPIVAWLRDPQQAEEQRKKLQQIRAKLGEPGAIDRAASILLQQLHSAAPSPEST